MPADPASPVDAIPAAPRSRPLLRLPTLGGGIGAVVFWWQSLEPTMMPRAWISQGVVSGLSVAAGYLVGTLLSHLAGGVLRRFDRSIGERARRVTGIVVASAATIAAVAGLVVWPRWQNDHRDLMDLDHISAATAIPMVLLTLVVAAIFVLLGRLVAMGTRGLDRRVAGFVPRPVSVVVTIALVAWLADFVLVDTAVGRLYLAIDSTYAELSANVDDDVAQPGSAAVSGSPASLVAWEGLGQQGRNFVADATTTDELAGFHGTDADVTEPVRVYVGLESADDAEARAELAVRELERAGGFERPVLAVVTATGTGWVDPFAATALEQLWAGDSAMVAIQYSYLPSWISTLSDVDASTDAGTALFNAVHERWSELPEDARPALLVFGQSLGSFGGEAAFAGLDDRASAANLVDRTDGALFTGPTNGNVVWGQLVDARDSGSPAWRPVYDGGEHIRFANSATELYESPPGWQAPRVLYVQHPSDGTTFWDVPTLWRSPDWIDHPVGEGVWPEVSWFPIVTWVQGVNDLFDGFGAGPGYGHDYSDVFVAAWAAIAAPDGWTAADTLRLEAFLGRDSHHR